jgi:hypothetical protein
MSRNSTEPSPRKIWRMTADAPMGEIVEADPADNGARPHRPSDDEWPETDWHASSYDLLNGCDIKDYTGRIPHRMFNALFNDD